MVRVRAKIIPLLILIAFTSACNLPLANQATEIVVSQTSVPTEPQVNPPTETPSGAEPTPTSGEIDGPVLEAILITQPGQLSVVTSPALVEGQSRPTFEQNLVVAVYDEVGTLLTQQPTTIQADAGSPGPFSVQVPFSVPSEQPGRISVYETSAMDGGIIHLSSVEVTLRPGGAAEIVPATIGLENIAIQDPPPNVEISGGSVEVSGFSEYYFESTLGLRLCGGGDGGGADDDLCGEAHNVLGSGVAMIDSPEMGQPGPFSGTLTFSVSEPTPARIVVFAASPRDGGLLHVSSIPVLLVP